MKKLSSIFILFILLFSFVSTTFAQTHTVKMGETYWKISQRYNVPLKSLMAANNAKNSYLSIGQKLTIPSSVAAWEKDLLARLVEAEAKGEPYAGKVAVATVVLNRVDSSLFPNTIYDVIYEKGQFTPVTNGTIKKPASKDANRAVEEAIAFRGQGSGSLYFYNPKKTTNTWLRSKKVTITIGNHVFAK